MTECMHNTKKVRDNKAWHSDFFKTKQTAKRGVLMNILNKIALAILIIGGLNWGSIALFSFNIVSWITAGYTTLANIIYIVVMLSAIYCIALLFRDESDEVDTHRQSRSHA